MTSDRSASRTRRRTSARVRRRRRLVASIGVLALLVIAGTVTAVALARGGGSPQEPQAQIASSTTPEASAPTSPPSPADALLATTDDASACAVTFAGEGIELDPVLQSRGALYASLPIPRSEGRVFAGWYGTESDAAALALPARVNGSDEVTCDDDRRVTLHAAWVSPAQNAAEDAGIPILMYHQFTTNPQGESNSLRLNYAYIGDFDAHMAYIAESGFYLPTWDELSAFIDGALFLPKHSVIVTDDDAHETWLELAAPVVEKHKVLTTSFVITKWRSEPSPNRYVLQRSHSHDMHDPGANGQGRMVNWSADEIAADLERSAQILGAKEVIAYPFGHYNDTAQRGVAQAGFEMARTIEQGYVRIGTDKLALPCIRINYGMGVDALRGLIG